jgi:hypothetical protein
MLAALLHGGMVSERTAGAQTAFEFSRDVPTRKARLNLHSAAALTANCHVPARQLPRSNCFGTRYLLKPTTLVGHVTANEKRQPKHN